jgi:nicotinate-nucleotide adenylyltransferase
MGMKLGIFGGSFNPVHLGHLLVAQAALEELGLERLFFVPAAQSPFKPENHAAAGAIRIQMLRLALAGKTRYEIDDQEIRRGGTSYTVDTVSEYAKRFAGAELYYLLGADNVLKLKEWNGANNLAAMAEFVAIPRPGESEAAFPKPFRGRTLKGFPAGISSSQIRDRVKAGLPVDHLVPPAVAEAIRNAKLYL